MIELLPPEDQAMAWPRLQHEVIKVQADDGSMWDYGMHAYHKPYGTAYGLLALGRSIGQHPATPGNGPPAASLP